MRSNSHGPPNSRPPALVSSYQSVSVQPLVPTNQYPSPLYIFENCGSQIFFSELERNTKNPLMTKTIDFLDHDPRENTRLLDWLEFYDSTRAD